MLAKFKDSEKKIQTDKLKTRTVCYCSFTIFRFNRIEYSPSDILILVKTTEKKARGIMH